MVRRNVARIDTAVANVEIMTDDGVAITRRLRDDTLARVDEALDAGTEAIDLAKVLRTIDLEVAASVLTIRAFLQDALIAAGEMKLATIEIRRSPWRILYQPQPGELANENLFAAARNFTIASSEVRSAARACSRCSTGSRPRWRTTRRYGRTSSGSWPIRFADWRPRSPALSVIIGDGSRSRPRRIARSRTNPPRSPTLPRLRRRRNHPPSRPRRTTRPRRDRP